MKKLLVVTLVALSACTSFQGILLKTPTSTPAASTEEDSILQITYTVPAAVEEVPQPAVKPDPNCGHSLALTKECAILTSGGSLGLPELQQPPYKEAVTTPAASQASTVDETARQAADEAAAMALQARETAEDAANLAGETFKLTKQLADQGSEKASGKSATSQSAGSTPTPVGCGKNTAKELLVKNNFSSPLFLRIDGRFTTRWLAPGASMFVCFPEGTDRHTVEAFAGNDGKVAAKTWKGNPKLSFRDSDLYTGVRAGPYLSLSNSDFRGFTTTKKSDQPPSAQP